MVDINVNLNIPIVEKLVDLVSSQLAHWLEPHHMRRKGRARIEIDQLKKLGDARSARHARLIEAGTTDTLEIRNNGKEIAESDQKYVSGVLKAHLGDVLRQDENLRNIIVQACEEISSNPDEMVRPDPIDSDWFMRWKNYARDVSQEDMQRLWAKVLVGEVRKPSSCSLRTLRFLSEISHDDAVRIKSVLSYNISCYPHKQNYIYNINEKHLDKSVFSYSDIFYSEEIGLLAGIGGFRSYAFPESESEKVRYSYFIYRHFRVVFCVSKTIRTSAYKLSKVGNDIFSMVCTDILTNVKNDNLFLYISAVIHDLIIKNGIQQTIISCGGVKDKPNYVELGPIYDYDNVEQLAKDLKSLEESRG